MSETSKCVSYEENQGTGIIRLSGGDAENPVDKVPVLNEERMLALEAVITEVEKKDLKGLVIIGAPGGAFCAGADINALQSISNAKDGAKLARRGQELFRKIEALPLRTVAAISGPCVGGGCELVLSCDYRVAADISATKIGLPEINLGILPGFGGTQRLPRLIGLPKALDIILGGKIIPAGRARKFGLVDDLVSGDNLPKKLEQAALRIASGEGKVQRKKISLTDSLLTYTAPGRMLVRSKSRSKVMKATKGKYPAPLEALDIVLTGLSKGREVGYKEEADALGRLAVTPVCKCLIHIFFLTESAKKLGKGGKDALKDLAPSVIGGGVMGRGVAASFINKGIGVTIADPSEEARSGAKNHIEKGLEKRRSLSDAEKTEYLKSLNLVEGADNLKSSNFVVEAATENLVLKRKIFSQLEDNLGEEAVLTSNTSSLPITEIAEGAKRPERIIGMHFFNPVEKMPLVEIIRGEKTSERTMVVTAAVASKLGKHPVVVEDVSGFLVNRVLTPYLVEAAILLSEGYSVVDIDKAASEFGMPMGPIRLLDEVGLDVVSKVSAIIESAYGDRMKGPRYADTLVEKGRLGKKSGAGFYIYDGKESTPDPELSDLLGLPQGESLAVSDKEMLSERLILRLVNEAVLCLDEGVAGQPGKEAAGQIDLASVMGIGFPAFRGGLIYYAESLGAKTLFDKLQHLSTSSGDRFTPSPGIGSRIRGGASFYGPTSLSEAGQLSERPRP